MADEVCLQETFVDRIMARIDERHTCTFISSTAAVFHPRIMQDDPQSKLLTIINAM